MTGRYVARTLVCAYCKKSEIVEVAMVAGLSLRVSHADGRTCEGPAMAMFDPDCELSMVSR